MSGFVKSLRSLARRLASKRSRANGARPAEAGAAWYDAMFAANPHYHCHYRESFYYFLWTVIADRLRRAGVKSVLEIGCGSGQLAALLFDQGLREYTGVDFSAAAISLAKKTAPQGRFIVGDAHAQELYTGLSCDALICTEVLEHIEDDLGVVACFPPGIRCICSVPNFPYESHVRHFNNVADVTNRYGNYFGDFDVCAFPSPRSSEDVFFLFEGRRNDAIDKHT
ncbi:MAG TPA: class I SAM-dependent methyltransferase [Gemmataceae bacterium]|nr:class I SAM-dependent methyltransferase [Gemmataceae bacterium]